MAHHQEQAPPYPRTDSDFSSIHFCDPPYWWSFPLSNIHQDLLSMYSLLLCFTARHRMSTMNGWMGSSALPSFLSSSWISCNVVNSHYVFSVKDAAVPWTRAKLEEFMPGPHTIVTLHSCEMGPRTVVKCRTTFNFSLSQGKDNWNTFSFYPGWEIFWVPWSSSSLKIKCYFQECCTSQCEEVTWSLLVFLRAVTLLDLNHCIYCTLSYC